MQCAVFISIIPNIYLVFSEAGDFYIFKAKMSHRYTNGQQIIRVCVFETPWFGTSSK